MIPNGTNDAAITNSKLDVPTKCNAMLTIPAARPIQPPILKVPSNDESGARRTPLSSLLDVRRTPPWAWRRT